jgi:hypothetical protein
LLTLANFSNVLPNKAAIVIYFTASTNSGDGAISVWEKELATIVPDKNKNPANPITRLEDTSPDPPESMFKRNIFMILCVFVFNKY